MLRGPGALAISLFCVWAARPSVVRAQAAVEGFTWQSSTELSFVSTSGNSSSSTLGLKGSVSGTHGPDVLKFEIGGIRASSDFTTRSAEGTVDDYTVTETVRSEKTAESYYARGRYDRDLGAGYAFAGVSWTRNTFAGVRNRYLLVGGFGRSFVDDEQGHLKSDLGLTYTIQRDVDPAPGADNEFGGAQLSVDALRRLSTSSTLGSVVVVDDNLESTSDVRVDWQTSLSVAINSTLALKTSFQMLFDNRPALVGVPLFAPGGAPAGVEVLTPGGKVDTVVTVTLVITL